MSFISDQVRRLDAAWDRISLEAPDFSAGAGERTQDELDNLEAQTARDGHEDKNAGVKGEYISSRLSGLQHAVRALSVSPAGPSGSRVLLHPTQIAGALRALTPDKKRSDQGVQVQQNHYETQLEWILAAKATTQTYGHVLDTLLNSTLSISDDLYYWDAVLDSRKALALYGLQIAPWQIWTWTTDVWTTVRAKLRGVRMMNQNTGELDSRKDGNVVTATWGQLYAIVRNVVRERSVRDARHRLLGRLTKVHTSVRNKQLRLKSIRSRNANALGVLLGEGLGNESLGGIGLTSLRAEAQTRPNWKASVAKNVALMEAVLLKVNDEDIETEKFDVAIAEITEDDPLYACDANDGGPGDVVSVNPRDVAERLLRVLTLCFPQYTVSTKALQAEYGRPSRIVRYWLPITLGLLSSSTILRILVNRQARVREWIEDFGTTIIDFWQNWVVEPSRRVIQTIRHDEGAEVSIMSKRSLEGDRASLERMVVDFAVDNPVNATGSSAKLGENEIAEIRAKVREGDLTPVLRAYEKDLSSPFMGTIRGNLIRALLIQIQKTKVDVEVAMGGIDAILKSQELVFGFIGLTPGILVTYFTLASLRSSISRRRDPRSSRFRGTAIRQMRNIDRILTDAGPTEFGELPYRDQGLLLCEVHILRQAVSKSLPASEYREFSIEADQLCDVRLGALKQKAVADRIRWAYVQKGP